MVSQQKVWRRLWRSKLAVAGGVMCIMIAATGVLAPVLARYDPLVQDSAHLLAPPSSLHPFGTDEYGRDILSRVVWGVRPTLFIGFMGLVLCSSVGTLIGLVSGSLGGAVDAVLARVIDVMMSFPPIIVAIAVVGVISPGTTSVILALGIAFAPRFARVVRGEVLTIRARDFVEAARALGASSVRLMLRHILRNAIDPLIVLATLYLPYIILVEASLDFLGIGVSADTPTWGLIIANGQGFVQLAPWISIPPGMALTVISVGINLIGDGVRDAFDMRVQMN